MSASAHDLDVATIESYARAQCDVVVARRREVDVRLDQMVEAREDAERAVAELHEACALAERYAAFAVRARAGDVDEVTLITAAHAIRALLGERTAA